MSIFKWPLKTGFTVFATKFVQNSQLGHDLHTTVNGSVILPILQGFIFAKLGICANFRENKTLAKMSEFTVFKPMNMMKACLAKVVRFMAQLEQHKTMNQLLLVLLVHCLVLLQLCVGVLCLVVQC